MDVFALVCSVCAALALVCVWALVCNDRTYKQRDQIIDTIYAQPDWKQLSAQFGAVGYSAHVLSLMLFRDPNKLYPFLAKAVSP